MVHWRLSGGLGFVCGWYGVSWASGVRSVGAFWGSLFWFLGVSGFAFSSLSIDVIPGDLMCIFFIFVGGAVFNPIWWSCFPFP